MAVPTTDSEHVPFSLAEKIAPTLPAPVALMVESYNRQGTELVITMRALDWAIDELVEHGVYLTADEAREALLKKASRKPSPRT